MDNIEINTNGYEIEREAPINEEYGEEVLCAGWNPQLALVEESRIAQTNEQVDLPTNSADADADVFLKNLYEFQR